MIVEDIHSQYHAEDSADSMYMLLTALELEACSPASMHILNFSRNLLGRDLQEFSVFLDQIHTPVSTPMSRNMKIRTMNTAVLGLSQLEPQVAAVSLTVLHLGRELSS